MFNVTSGEVKQLFINNTIRAVGTKLETKGIVVTGILFHWCFIKSAYGIITSAHHNVTNCALIDTAQVYYALDHLA